MTTATPRRHRAAHALAGTVAAGFPAVRLDAWGGLSATVVPGLAMLVASHRGEELLGHPGTLRDLAGRGEPTGVPLHPWANRLGGTRLAGVPHPTIDPASPLVPTDEHGLPIHGLRTWAGGGWREVARAAGRDGAHVAGAFGFPASGPLADAFPFPHRVTVLVSLRGDTLQVVTRVRATGSRPVPVAFGWHPYLRLPGVPRARWQVTLPVRRRAVLDARGIPVGREEEVRIPPGPLGDLTCDDLFTGLDREPAFVLQGGGRRVEARLGPGYAVAQVYAPAAHDVVAFEPMTAPTNAVLWGEGLRLPAPGREHRATFALRVTEVPA